MKRHTLLVLDFTKTNLSFQVLAPNDVQFALSSEDEKEEVVINANSVSNSLCVDTAAFVGVTVTFLMILIVALITIFFLWMRIKTMDKKQLL
jgi:RsiW-degrading membrane proteinase PrsW (M82 family)